MNVLISKKFASFLPKHFALSEPRSQEHLTTSMLLSKFLFVCLMTINLLSQPPANWQGNSHLGSAGHHKSSESQGWGVVLSPRGRSQGVVSTCTDGLRDLRALGTPPAGAVCWAARLPHRLLCTTQAPATETRCSFQEPPGQKTLPPWPKEAPGHHSASMPNPPTEDIHSWEGSCDQERILWGHGVNLRPGSWLLCVNRNPYTHCSGCKLESQFGEQFGHI